MSTVIDNTFYCEACGHTVDTANMASHHENQKHHGAQTMWTSRERKEATAIRSAVR